MKSLFRKAALLAICTLSPSPLPAERMPDVPGTANHYVSNNGRYDVTITIGELFPSWSLKQDGRELWNGPLMSEPGDAAVSDNGETIALPLWGWRDEGGWNGIALFNKKGEHAGDIRFSGNGPEDRAMRWVRCMELSPDGRYAAVGENGKQQAEVSLFDTATGGTVWSNRAGLPDIAGIRISEQGIWTLVATRKNGDMVFNLFDRRGKSVWQKKIAGNFSYDIKTYLRFNSDLKGFAVYRLKPGGFVSERMPSPSP